MLYNKNFPKSDDNKIRLKRSVTGNKLYVLSSGMYRLADPRMINTGLTKKYTTLQNAEIQSASFEYPTVQSRWYRPLCSSEARHPFVKAGLRPLERTTSVTAQRPTMVPPLPYSVSR